MYRQRHRFLTHSLTDRMGVQPILSVKVSVIIDTMLSFDGDFDEQSDDGTTCKRTCIQGIETTHVHNKMHP